MNHNDFHTDYADELAGRPYEAIKRPIIIPADSVDACRLIVKEAAAVLQGHAERLSALADPNDWKSQTAAALTADYVKKLAWVHSLLTPPTPPR